MYVVETFLRRRLRLNQHPNFQFNIYLRASLARFHFLYLCRKKQDFVVKQDFNIIILGQKESS